MKIACMTIMLALAAVAAPPETVTVSMGQCSSLPFSAQVMAPVIASQMFARIGVRIDWHARTPKGSLAGLVVR